MTIEEAIKTLDGVIPAPGNKMVDQEHLAIAIAWATIRRMTSTQMELRSSGRLTARDPKSGLPYFPECFKEPCCGAGCQDDECEFMTRVCIALADFEDAGAQLEKDIYEGTKCLICQNLPESHRMTECPYYSKCGLGYMNFKWRGSRKEELE